MINTSHSDSMPPSLKLLSQGKVRDIYAISERELLLVTSDRISAFDVVLPDAIPGKGAVLNQLAAYWLERTGHIIDNHLLETDVEAMGLPPGCNLSALAGRSMLVRRTRPILVECVARGYITGSAWKEYLDSGTACGLALPPGLAEAQKLPQPIFTPATKAQSGHDENISFEQMESLVGAELAARLRATTLALYQFGHDHAAARGIILADTKFEFGLFDGQLLLIDEVLTPDSSRFWDAGEYAVGSSPPSYDKQFVRDWLVAAGWDQNPPAPPLPADIIATTAEKYAQALSLIAAPGPTCPST